MAYIQKLSNEILSAILDNIESESQRCVSVDRREYLSVESFRLPSPPLPSQAQDVANFRLTCQRFAELGIPYQYARVTLRFSSRGFRRLDNICSNDRLIKHTRKFSYLVPLFYGNSKSFGLLNEAQANEYTIGRVQVSEFLRSTRPADSYNSLHAASLGAKEKDQTTILRSGEDVRILRKAMAAFTALQHVQILRLTDEADQRLLKLLERDELDAAPSGQPVVELRSSPECYHATKTIAEDLMFAQSSFNKFSGPMMSPQSMLAIQRNIPQTLSSFASGLTCLELHFEDGADVNTRIQELSSLFRAVLSAAKNLQAVHIGFPSRTPLDLNLEDIFHDIKWDKLRAFGIQACRLEAREIIWLARRHSKTLRGLRLRDVLLKEDSMWKDVLQVLRTEMEQLDWVSLRRIDYSNHFDDSWVGSMEVPDDTAFGSSDSDEEEDFLGHLSDPDLDSDLDTDSDNGSEDSSNADTDHGPDANELALSPDTPASLPFCTCPGGSHALNADDLGDNGHSVTYPQRKMWEKWVIGDYCPEHSG